MFTLTSQYKRLCLGLVTSSELELWRQMVVAVTSETTPSYVLCGGEHTRRMVDSSTWECKPRCHRRRHGERMVAEKQVIASRGFRKFRQTCM